MTLIKNAAAEKLSRSAVVLDLGDLRREADRIIAEARVEAGSIIEEARAEEKRLVDSAAEQGYDEGRARGEREGREAGVAAARQEVLEEFRPQLQNLEASWSAALEQWEADRREMLLAARTDVLRFAFRLARKIILRQIEADPTIIETQLAEAMSLVSRPTSVLARINPEDRPVIETALPDLVVRFPHCEHARIKEDPAMTRGGCVLSTANGRIDATIETQLDRIAGALLPFDDDRAERKSGDGARPPDDDARGAAEP